MLAFSAISRMTPLMLLEESSKVSRTAVQSLLKLSRRSARMTVDAFWVALDKRKIPLPGSASVVVVEKVYGMPESAFPVAPG